MNASTKPAATILDLDEMMDTKIDSVETIPDFITPPPGKYVLIVKDCKTEKYEGKPPENKKGSRIRITYAIVETLEVIGDELPYPNGSLFSESFMGTEDGLKFFKKSAMNILGVTDFEGASIRDVIEGVKESEFKATIAIRKSKSDGKEYENISIRATNPTVAAE